MATPTKRKIVIPLRTKPAAPPPPKRVVTVALHGVQAKAAASTFGPASPNAAGAAPSSSSSSPASSGASSGPYNDGVDGGVFTGAPSPNAATGADAAPTGATQMTTPVKVGLGVGAAAVVGLLLRAAIK